MLSLAPSPTIFLHTDATDMRKSFTGLCGLIRSVFGDDPAHGSIFLLVNQRRDRIPGRLRKLQAGSNVGNLN